MLVTAFQQIERRKKLLVFKLITFIKPWDWDTTPATVSLSMIVELNTMIVSLCYTRLHSTYNEQCKQLES